MERTANNFQANRDEYIFLPGHPDADEKGFINVNNPNLLSEMANYILQAKKAFHEMELKNRKKLRASRF